MGDGRHGFVFHIPEDVTADGLDRVDYLVVTSGRERVVLGHQLGGIPPSAAESPRDIDGFFKPYLAQLRAMPLEGLATWRVDRRAVADTLCAPAIGVAASAFADHIARKYERGAVLESDPREFWDWYIGGYAVEQGPKRAPLSRDDIETLKRTGTIGLRPADDTSGTAALERRYDRAIEEARRLFVEDCLVSEDDLEALRAVSAGQEAREYPLSNFMMLLKRRHGVLRHVPTFHQKGRQRLYTLCVLLALRSPHYLTFMPHQWLLRLLAPGPPRSPFERILGELFGPSHTISAAQCVDLLDAKGYDVASQTFVGTAYRSHRILGGSSVVEHGAPVDVQFIGPLRGRLGLAESCRRFAEALKTLPLSLNFVDYELGGASRQGGYDVATGRPRAARINILHLNAEEIPEACAYLPDVFSGAHTIAVPYWELDAPSRAHRLGLALVDEVWAASDFLQTVFGKGGACPVTWTGISFDDRGLASLDKSTQRRRYGIKPETFVFITTSDALSWFQRKNPLGAIEAFRLAFPGREDVALVVKTRNLAEAPPGAWQEVWKGVSAASALDPRITIVDDALADSEHRALLGSCDCLVSLHRAEGLGLDVLDAMSIGLPIVATAYSGNMDFCSHDTAWLVEAAPTQVRPSDYCFVEAGHLWAEPRIASAIAAMRGVYDDRQLRANRALAGQKLVRRRFSREAFADRLGGLLSATLAAS